MKVKEFKILGDSFLVTNEFCFNGYKYAGYNKDSSSVYINKNKCLKVLWNYSKKFAMIEFILDSERKWTELVIYPTKQTIEDIANNLLDKCLKD